jgi:hypothetical protein
MHPAVTTTTVYDARCVNKMVAAVIGWCRKDVWSWPIWRELLEECSRPPTGRARGISKRRWPDAREQRTCVRTCDAARLLSRGLLDGVIGAVRYNANQYFLLVLVFAASRHEQKIRGDRPPHSARGRGPPTPKTCTLDDSLFPTRATTNHPIGPVNIYQTWE